MRAAADRGGDTVESTGPGFDHNDPSAEALGRMSKALKCKVDALFSK